MRGGVHAELQHVRRGEIAHVDEHDRVLAELLVVDLLEIMVLGTVVLAHHFYPVRAGIQSATPAYCRRHSRLVIHLGVGQAGDLLEFRRGDVPVVGVADLPEDIAVPVQFLVLGAGILDPACGQRGDLAAGHMVRRDAADEVPVRQQVGVQGDVVILLHQPFVNDIALQVDQVGRGQLGTGRRDAGEKMVPVVRLGLIQVERPRLRDVRIPGKRRHRHQQKQHDAESQ